VFSEILDYLKVNMLKNDFADFLFANTILFGSFKCVYPIDANDMVLESYRLGAMVARC
jgi:hypothetical protein